MTITSHIDIFAKNLDGSLSGFFVKFGGKFFSAHLANSVSAYIFL